MILTHLVLFSFFGGAGGALAPSTHAPRALRLAAENSFDAEFAYVHTTSAHGPLAALESATSDSLTVSHPADAEWAQVGARIIADFLDSH